MHRNTLIAWALLAGICRAAVANATVEIVGAGQQYTTVAAAIAASQNGDVIQVEAGTYTNDFAVINDSITLQAVGGMVNMIATNSPTNSKGIFTIGTSSNAPDVTINGFSFSGAAISASLGDDAAGIRYQGGNLMLNNDLFEHNQIGILATPFVPGTGTVTVNASEFLDNGIGTGSAIGHNIYIGRIASFTMTGSTSEGAIVGHEVKSRALNTTLLNNLISDGPDGTSSYSIDIPDGGNATIENNVIEQGPKSENPVIIAYGEESGQSYNPGTDFMLSGNTIINDQENPDDVAIWNATTVMATGADNQIYGLTPAQLVRGPGTADLSGTTYYQEGIDPAPEPGIGPVPDPGIDPVPEPGGLLLFGTGLLGLGVVGLRHHKNS